MATGVNDKYANVATVSVTASGASVVFSEFITGISLATGMGILIDKIEYWFNKADQQVLINNESMMMGIVTNNSLTAIDPSKAQVLHHTMVHRTDYGTAANALLHKFPTVFDFVPPMIVAAPKLYLAFDSSDAGSANIHYARIYFRYIKLTTQEYLELAEAFILS